MSGLTDTYCAWFEGLAPEVARDLALHLMRLGPGGLFESSILTSDPLDGFAARLRRLAREPLRDVGTALTLAALTDFLFAERGDPRRWEQNEELLEILDEAQQTIQAGDEEIQGELAQWIAQNRLRYPLRARQWLKEHAGWKQLREGELSAESIQRTLDQQRFTPPA